MDFQTLNTLHVSDGLSIHHQESKTVNTASAICHTGSVAACYMDTKDMDCIILVQDREQCRDVVNTNTQNAGNFRTTMPVLGPSQRCSKRFGSSGI
jgi:hypothetical protein